MVCRCGNWAFRNNSSRISEILHPLHPKPNKNSRNVCYCGIKGIKPKLFTKPKNCICTPPKRLPNIRIIPPNPKCPCHPCWDEKFRKKDSKFNQIDIEENELNQMEYDSERDESKLNSVKNKLHSVQKLIEIERNALINKLNQLNHYSEKGESKMNSVKNKLKSDQNLIKIERNELINKLNKLNYDSERDESKRNGFIKINNSSEIGPNKGNLTKVFEGESEMIDQFTRLDVSPNLDKKQNELSKQINSTELNYPSSNYFSKSARCAKSTETTKNNANEIFDSEKLKRLNMFRKKHYFDTHSSEALEIPEHQCIHRFELNQRGLPAPLNPDIYGQSRCIICDKVMNNKRNIAKRKESSIPNYYDHKLAPEQVFIGNGDYRIEITDRNDQHHILPLRKPNYFNTFALKYQKGVPVPGWNTTKNTTY